MAPENQAAWVTAKLNRDLKVDSAPYPSPAKHQLVVRTAAVAINPLDWIIRDVGNMAFTWLSYPTILGSDLAGEVVEVGSDVKRFKPGDRILGITTGTEKDQNDPACSAFQNYALVADNVASIIPDSMSFERAVVIPLGLSTAACGLFKKDQLGLRLPTAPAQDPAGETVIVWGGSSSVGCNAIQLAVAAGYDAVALASPRNFDYLKGLGASQTLDYNSETIEKDLIAALDGKTVAGALYMGAGAESLNTCINVLSNCKGKRFVSLAAMPYAPPKDGVQGLGMAKMAVGFISAGVALKARTVLKGVQTNTIWGGDIREPGLGDEVFGNFLQKALADGSFVPAPEPLVVGSGLDKIQEAIEKQKDGVSAQKVVVTL